MVSIFNDIIMIVMAAITMAMLNKFELKMAKCECKWLNCDNGLINGLINDIINWMIYDINNGLFNGLINYIRDNNAGRGGTSSTSNVNAANM